MSIGIWMPCPHLTELILFLSRKHTWRTIIYDSWFTSPEASIELFKMGLYSIGSSKHGNRSKVFPALMLKETVGGCRGDTAYATKEEQGCKMLATVWRDKGTKLFLSTTSNADISDRPRITRNDTVIPRPNVCADYFDNAAAIDIGNHYRQGGTSLEEAAQTHVALHKYFFGVMGMCFTNAFLAYKNFKPHMKHMKHINFKKLLVKEMLYNDLDVVMRSTRSSLTPPPTPCHQQHALRELPKSIQGGQLRQKRQRCKGVTCMSTLNANKRPRISDICTCNSQPYCKSCFAVHVQFSMLAKVDSGCLPPTLVTPYQHETRVGHNTAHNVLSNNGLQTPINRNRNQNLFF